MKTNFELMLVVTIVLFLIIQTIAHTPAVAAGSETVMYTYDNLGRLTSVEYPNGTTITYTYDAVGNRIGCQVTTNVMMQAVAVSPSAAGAVAQYSVAFSPGASGTLTASDVVAIVFPAGTTVPTAIDYHNVFVATSGTATATNPPVAGVSVSGQTVYVQVPAGYGVGSSGTMTILFSQMAGIKNPPLSSHAGDGTFYRIAVFTSKETTPVQSEAYTIDDWITASPMALLYVHPTTVTGHGFKPGATVDLSGGAIGSGVVDADGTFTTTAYGTGVADFIRAADTSGRSAMTSTQTTVVAKISVNPCFGMPGSTVTIKGVGFSPLADITQASIGMVNVLPHGLTTDSMGNFQFETTVPDLQEGYYAVCVTVSDQTRTTVFSVSSVGILLTPARGAGGTTVVIEGWDFTDGGNIPANGICFAGVPVAPAETTALLDLDGDGSADDFQTTFVVPVDSTGGPKKVTVVDNAGSSWYAGFDVPCTDICLSLDLSRGPRGTPLLVTGYGMTPNGFIPAGNLTFGGVPWNTQTIWLDTMGQLTPTVLNVPDWAIPGTAYEVKVTDSGSRTATCTFTVTGEATLYLNPAQGARGTLVTATGSGWVPGSTVAIALYDIGLVVAASIPDSGGNIWAQYNIPSSVGAGPRTIRFFASSESQMSPVVDFFVYPPRLYAEPGSGLPGTNVTVTGTGFIPNTGVSILAIGGVSVLPPGLTTSGTGSFIVTFNVPSLAPGRYIITATAGDTAEALFKMVGSEEVWVDDNYYDGGLNGGHTWGVDAFASIQSGVDGVSSGGTVHVSPGTYFENVDVAKPVTIESVSGDPTDTIVNGTNPNDDVFHVSADSVTIRGFSACGATEGGHAGIYVAGVDYCSIENNRCGWDATHYNCYGVALSSAAHNTVSNNRCAHNTYVSGGTDYGVGVLITNSSSENAVSLNICSANGSGIALTHSNFNDVRYNTCDSNFCGIALVSQAEGNNVHHNGVSLSAYGLVLYGDAMNNTVENNNITESAEYALFNYQSYDATVGRNYWGNAPNMGALIYDKNDDPSLGLVTYGQPLPDPVGLSITLECPVDMIVTDPDGLTISKTLNEIPGATYMEVDLNGDGDPDDQVIIPEKKNGDYLIEVIPEPGADPSDTFTLKVTIGGETTILADSILVSDIPGEPYVVSFAVSCDVEISTSLQGSSRPDPAGWEIPVTVKFFAPGADVLNDTPLYTFDTTTTKSGDIAVCGITGISPGTYDITVVSEHTLMNVKRNVVISAPDTSVDMGTLLEGDWNGNLVIDWEDLGTVLLTYDKCEGDEGFDPAADFNRNGCIDWEDLGLVLINYDKTSPVEVP